MTENHSFPIVPPPELVRQWLSEEYERGLAADHVATQAARWGADQELEACIEWLEQNQGRWEIPASLRAARRPKPPSLKEQALIHFDSYAASFETSGGDSDLIRRALEQLPDNE